MLDLLLVFATLFVVGSIYTSVAGRQGGNDVFMQADKAELSLKVSSSMLFLKGKGADKMADDMVKKAYDEADTAIKKATELAPESATLLSKSIIFRAETGRPFKKELEKLNKLTTEKAKKLSRVVSAVYVNRKVSEAEIPELKQILKEHMPSGWYYQTISIQLEKAAGHKKQYEKALDQFVEHYQMYIIKVAAFCVIAIFSGFIGVIVILAQLFFLPRNPTGENQRELIAAPEGWNLKTVYAVFIGWLSTEFIVGPMLKGVSTELANIAVEKGSLVVALITAGLYLSQNLPSLFYIWLFAFRKNKINFFEGLKIRFKVANRGPIRLILAGVLTWFAAIPLVVVATIIATKLGSTGSSNPIIAVVLSSVKDSNPLAVFMFIMTLGVFPAICEESLFRGFLYTTLRKKWGFFPSMVFTAFLFSIAHLDLGGSIQLFVLGCLFAYVLERTKSLVPAMVAHCMWNSATFLMALTMFG